MFWNVWYMYIKSQRGSRVSVLLVLRQWPSREAIEFCSCSAGTEWRSCRIILV